MNGRRSDIIGADCPTGSTTLRNTQERVAIGFVVSFVVSIASVFSLLVIVGLTFFEPRYDVERKSMQANEGQAVVVHR